MGKNNTDTHSTVQKFKAGVKKCCEVGMLLKIEVIIVFFLLT